MSNPRKFKHNALSSDSPQHFRGDFSEIFEKKPIRLGKKIIHQERIQEIVQRRQCSSLPPMNIDQDFDSIKFSVRNDVFQGIKDSIRHKSNFYKNFFEGIRQGFNKPPNEITFMQPVHKIIRVENKPISNLNYQKSIARMLEKFNDSKVPTDIDPGNKLLSNYESEISNCESPTSTKVNFLKNSQPNFSKIGSKIKCILISSEIKEFEKRMPKPVKNRGNHWYKMLASSPKDT